MHIKMFNNLSLGKNGGKGKDKTGEKTNDKNKKQHRAPEDGKELASPGDISKVLDTAPARPHGPAEELTLENENAENSDVTLDEVEDTGSIKLGEMKVDKVTAEQASAIKVVPATAANTPPAAAPPAPPEAKTEAKSEGTDSLGSLFATDDEEENPLAALINSLPDVSVQELMEDLMEIHRIIKEWKPVAK